MSFAKSSQLQLKQITELTQLTEEEYRKLCKTIASQRKMNIITLLIYMKVLIGQIDAMK